MDTPLSTPPIRGQEYFVEADIFGIESAASIRFELVDAAGRTLQVLTMWKASDGSTDGEFYGFVTVPSQPFRAAVTGTNRNGILFRSVLSRAFEPVVNGPSEQPILPAGISSAQYSRLQSMVAAYRKQMKTRAAQAEADHPAGVIALSKAVVSRIAYEPLNSSSGAPIGVRLHYSIQFPTRQTIVAVPHVFPVYPAPDWRGIVAMKALGGTITPVPEMVGVQSLADVISYRASATYQAGSTYTFTVDMVPDYVFQGTQSRRFCLHEQKFTNRTAWSALIASQTPIPYSISITDTETTASIPVFFPQKTFYDSFHADGAIDCGPAPNIRF